MKIDDPTPTYRGYRRQALYALFRLFDDVFGDDASVQPEGVEDLAVYDANNSLVEVVQVKDYTSNLVASSFKPFFYDRIAIHCQPNSPTSVKIASFGPIGPDLIDAKMGDTAAKKRVIETIAKERVSELKKPDGSKETFKTPGLSIEQATKIVDKLEIQRVSETQLTEAIERALSRTVVGTNPKDAFEFLMWWIITSSESKQVIRRRDAIQKLQKIGSFLAGREAFHAEWYRSIVPLGDDTRSFSEDATKSLKEAFFRGGRVSFEHILADVDVPRSRALIRIHEAFGDSNVVVVHSASGQGKTTLAFRYLKEFAPAVFRLQMRSADSLGHARQMALAIRQQSSVLGVPTLVYIDVQPGDVHWVEQVRELSAESSLRVLVTIREEDWQRSISAAADIFVAEVSLEFDSVEAKQLYESLKGQLLTKTHLDFEEAWTQFGPRKCLLEFVYFVTQAETLTQRIRAQISCFQEEVRTGKATSNEEQLLRLVAVASSYEARLDLVETLKACNLASPLATLRRFENEYFIRESVDGKRLDGFHAIRSEVLCENLTDPVLMPWGRIAAQAIPLMDERDLESFLLCTFSRRPSEASQVVDAIRVFAPRTWSGFCGVAKALMWLGLREYWEDNSAVLHEAFDKAASGWILILNSDVARVHGEGGWKVFENAGSLGDRINALNDGLREKQTDVSTVFKRVEKWIMVQHQPPATPNDEREWIAMAEMMFWCGHLRTGSQCVSLVTQDLITKATSTLPLYLLGDFIRGIRVAAPREYDEWFDHHRSELIDRVRREAAIVKLYESDSSIAAHYIIDLDTESSRLKRIEDDATAKASLRDLTMERVQLLSDLVPGRQRYGAVGYGHRQSLFSVLSDDANKPGVLEKYLPSRWLPEFNGLSMGLCNIRFRPADWDKFFDRLRQIRTQLLSCCVDLRDAIDRSKRNPEDRVFIRQSDQWQECRREFNVGLPFPRNAMDEWGFVTESSMRVENAPPQSKRRFNARRYETLRQALSEYTRTAFNFLDQSLGPLLFAPALRAAKTNDHRNALLLAAKGLNVSEDAARLSVINGVELCQAVSLLQQSLNGIGSLDEWRHHEEEQREQEEIVQTMNLWAEFCFPMTKRESPSKTKANLAFEWALRPILNRLRNELQSLRRQGIIAKVVTDVIRWDGKPGLWIQMNTIHPALIPLAIEKTWEAIRRAFGPRTESPVPAAAANYVWNEIVVAPTVNGLSIDRRAFRRMKNAAFREVDSLDGLSWAFVPDEVPHEVWNQVRIACWETTPLVEAVDKFFVAYQGMHEHSQHIADFERLEEIDEFGMSILQGYLHREGERVGPMIQATYDSLAVVMSECSRQLEIRPCSNIFNAMHSIVEIGETLMSLPKESEESGMNKVTVNDFVVWRDKVSAGFDAVGRIRLFLVAYEMNCLPLAKGDK